MLIFFSGKFLFNNNNEITAFFDGESTIREQLTNTIVKSEGPPASSETTPSTRFIDELPYDATKSEKQGLGAAAIESESNGLLKKIKKARGIELEKVALPNVGASAYLVADLDSGQVYAEKRPDDVRAVASISKLMTALVASDSIAPERMIIVSKDAVNTYGNVASFTLGEKMPLSEMFYPLLLYSANDAALAIADYYGEDSFVALMNKQARLLGMTNSTFVEPSGLSGEDVSTANDLFKLARYIYNHKSSIFEITQIDSKTVSSTTAENTIRNQTFKNIHQLRHMEGYLGGKNGYINASGQTLLTLFKVQNSKGSERTIAIIVLGSSDSARDSLSLLSWFSRSI